MKRKSARAIIMKDEKFVLIHRIKEKEGKKIEYYVFPGGGIEMGETYEQTVVRESYEELGIKIKPEKRLYYLEEEDRDEMFLLCNYVTGEIGTGQGPEFTSPDYKERGQYLPELVSIDKFREISILKPIKEAILKDVEKYGSLSNAKYTDFSEMER